MMIGLYIYSIVMGMVDDMQDQAPLPVDVCMYVRAHPRYRDIER